MTQKTALVVDDSRSARFAMRKFLEGAGYAVDTAESAQDAYLYLQRRHPQVIFLDHQMPGSDGLEVLRALKDDEESADIPVVLCSGQESDATFVADARSAGAVAVLAKPPDADQLKSLLSGLNDGPRDRSPSHAGAPVRTPPSLGLPTHSLVADLRASPSTNEDRRHATADDAPAGTREHTRHTPVAATSSSEIVELRQALKQLQAEVAALRQTRERSVEQLLPALLEALEEPVRRRSQDAVAELLQRNAEQMLDTLRTRDDAG